MSSIDLPEMAYERFGESNWMTYAALVEEGQKEVSQITHIFVLCYTGIIRRIILMDLFEKTADHVRTMSINKIHYKNGIRVYFIVYEVESLRGTPVETSRFVLGNESLADQISGVKSDGRESK